MASDLGSYPRHSCSLPRLSAVAHAPARVEQESAVRCHQHINVPEAAGNRRRPDHLRAVHEHDRAGLAGQAADRGDIGPVAGRRLHAAEGDQLGAGVLRSPTSSGSSPPAPESRTMRRIDPLSSTAALGLQVFSIFPPSLRAPGRGHWCMSPIRSRPLGGPSTHRRSRDQPSCRPPRYCRGMQYRE
jgi:hypothetical protein